MEIGTIIGIIILIIGFVLVAVELVLPGFGLPGIAGGICLLAGVFLTARTVEEGILIAIVVIVILGILMTVILSLLAHQKVKSPIILDSEVKGPDAFLNSIAAARAGMNLSFEKASAIDLAGRDVFEAVTMSVTPKVIETDMIAAVAKDGIELLVKARVTVRTNLERLIGGAGEATVLACIGEGIVTTVGSSKTHSEVLENPDDISKVVLEKGLDSGTAFEIISIDVADIDVGRNIGANLQSMQAEADNKIAQARAEERRAMAVALEQEMRASVVQAEAEVPKAMAEALRSGNIGVLDYYRLQNVMADTEMKQNIGNGANAYAESKR